MKYCTKTYLQQEPHRNRTSHEADGIQWIRMEELGKALTNTCRAVLKLKEKTRKTQGGTRDRHTNSEELEFECQLKNPHVAVFMNSLISEPHLHITTSNP